jgi:SAM-dependent methyltransferase
MRAALLPLPLLFVLILLGSSTASAQVIPDEMRACEQASDCVILRVPCGAPEAVNAKQRDAAAKLLPRQNCLGALVDVDALCVHGRCVTSNSLGGPGIAAPPPPRDPTGESYDADPETYARHWDDPARDRWQMPDHVLSIMAIAPGMTVVDIGAGTGYFEPHLDRAVGEGGRVLALDVEPKLVSYVEARGKKEGWQHTIPTLVARDDPGLVAESVDRVLIVDSWHHIDGREAYARKLAAALRPGGRVIIVDYAPDSPIGPSDKHRLAPRKVISELAAAGLKAQLVREKLPRQYVVVGRKTPAP